MTQTRRKSFGLRPVRFTPEATLKSIVKNTNARCSSFWLDVENLSNNGLCISYHGLGCLPIEVDSELLITLDVTCKVFARPIHLKVEVTRKMENLDEFGQLINEETLLGTRIVEVDSLHHRIWEEGLKVLEMTPSLSKKRSA